MAASAGSRVGGRGILAVLKGLGQREGKEKVEGAVRCSAQKADGSEMVDAAAMPQWASMVSAPLCASTQSTACTVVCDAKADW